MNIGNFIELGEQCFTNDSSWQYALFNNSEFYDHRLHGL